MEAAGRFLRWREVDRVVRALHPTTPQRVAPEKGISSVQSLTRSVVAGNVVRTLEGRKGWRGWDKERWEREWMADFSRDVAVGVREMKGESLTLGGSHLTVRAETRSVRASGVYVPPSPAGSYRGRLAERGNEGGDDGEGQDDVLAFDEKHAVAPRIITYTHSHSFDPLHFPSLVLFTVSMLGPLKTRFVEAVRHAC